MSKKSIEFFTFSTEERILNYGGFCKLRIDTLSRQIIVEPDDEDVKMVSAMFDSNFIVKENILIAESSKNLTNFGLSFKSLKIAQKVFNAVTKNTIINIDSHKWFKDEFLPIFSNSGNENIKSVYEKYLKLCEKLKMKETERNLRPSTLWSNNSDKENQIGCDNINQRERKTLKRKRNQVGTNGRRTGRKKPKQSDYAQTFRCSNYKLFTYKHKDKLRKKLYIFDVDDDSELCHKYAWNEMNNLFECCTCPRRSKQRISTAKLYKKEKDYVEFRFHGCKAYKYDPGRCEERTRIYKPEYKIIKGIIRRKERQRLIVFDPTNMELCYMYSLSSDLQTYECLGCRRFRKSVSSKIYFENSENEYVELFNEDHVCELRPYDPKNIFQIEKILHPPDFEFQKISNLNIRGRESKKLIVFDSNDRKYCYEYYLNKSTFRCQKCLRKDKNVCAKYNPKENILRLNSNPHICERQIYVPGEVKKDIILESCQFMIIPTFQKNGLKKLIVFHETDKSLCYSFLRSRGIVHFCCNGCAEMKFQFMVTLCKDDDDKYYVKIKPNQKPHVCIPKKLTDFDLKPPNIIKTFDFLFYKNKMEATKMIIFTTSEKKYCYEYHVETNGKTLICWKCKTTTTTSNFCQNQNGEGYYFQYLPEKHTCKPFSYSVVKAKVVKILEPNECTPSGKADDKINKITQFKLRPDKNNIKDAILILFHPTDQTLCYHYKYHKGVNRRYHCISCYKKNLQVSASLKHDKNGQKYIVQGERKHECDAIEYVPDNQIKKFTNFIEFTEKNVEKLIVFTSDAKTHCYVYRKAQNAFRCTRCVPTKYVMANLLIDENETKFLEFGKYEHICTPQEYNPAKYAISKRLSLNEFELFPNTKGAPDSRLIILDSNDSIYGYEYKFTDRFNCVKCLAVTKKRIFAKLVKIGNGEKCLELSKNEHLCQKLNFLEMGRIIYLTDYEFDSGKENQSITVKHQKDQKLRYKFLYDSNLKVFYCIGCQRKKKFISAKICKRSNNDEFLLLAFDHVCVPVSV